MTALQANAKRQRPGARQSRYAADLKAVMQSTLPKVECSAPMARTNITALLGRVRDGRRGIVCCASVTLRGVASMDLFVRPGANVERREAVLLDWHRASLRSVITDLLAHWQPNLGVQATHWGIKKMKTKWGSCNVSARRIWLNLELAKKPVQCLEYIVVHELVHLLERNHTERFTALMDRHLPDWRTRREVLNSSPLGHEAWEY